MRQRVNKLHYSPTTTLDTFSPGLIQELGMGLKSGDKSILSKSNMRRWLKVFLTSCSPAELVSASLQQHEGNQNESYINLGKRSMDNYYRQSDGKEKSNKKENKGMGYAHESNDGFSKASTP